MLARGLSVRDIEDAFKDENGRWLLSEKNSMRNTRPRSASMHSRKG